MSNCNFSLFFFHDSFYRIRLYDLRAATFPMLTLAGHSAKVTCVEMDDWKMVSADEAGFVFVWDQRMARKLWDVHNRYIIMHKFLKGNRYRFMYHIMLRNAFYWDQYLFAMSFFIENDFFLSLISMKHKTYYAIFYNRAVIVLKTITQRQDKSK